MNDHSIEYHRQPSLNPIQRLVKFIGELEIQTREVTRAEKLANKINRKYNPYPVPPIWAENTALKMGLSIVTGGDDQLGKDVVRLKKDAGQIWLNQKHEAFPLWNNFAIAAMIGHYVLPHEAPVFALNPDKPKTDRQSREAKLFASHLVMPDELMRGYAWADSSDYRVPSRLFRTWETYRQEHQLDQAPISIVHVNNR